MESQNEACSDNGASLCKPFEMKHIHTQDDTVYFFIDESIIDSEEMQEIDNTKDKK